MESIAKLIVSGYVIGISCVVYFALRSWLSRPKSDNEAVSWVGLLLFSTGVSFIWSLVGAGFHFILENDSLFMIISFAIVAVITCLLLFVKSANRVDKIAINSIIFGGMGLLIPFLF